MSLFSKLNILLFKTTLNSLIKNWKHLICISLTFKIRYQPHFQNNYLNTFNGQSFMRKYTSCDQPTNWNVKKALSNKSPKGAAEERPEFYIKPPLGAPVMIYPQGYLLKSLPQRDISTRQQGFEVSAFPLLGELLKAIEHHLPDCQINRWQLGPTGGVRL